MIKESELNRKHATNGDVIKHLLYGKAVITEFIHEVNISVNNKVIGQFQMEWWRSPYKGGSGMIEIKAKQSSYSEMTDHELAKALLDYSRSRDGEISEITQAAGVRIEALTRILEAKEA